MENHHDDRKMEDVLKELNTKEIQNVRFEFLDTNSVARSKTIPVRHFSKAVNSGISFPVVIFASDPHLDINKKSPLLAKYLTSDMICYPDLTTFTTLPWVKNTARVFVSATPASTSGNNNEVLLDPRSILKNQLEKLKAKDLSIFSSLEYEFWLVDEATREPVISGTNAWSTLRLAKHQQFIDQLVLNLLKAGVDIDSVQTEYGKGMFEITMEPSFGIRSADNAATFRTGIKEMAMQEGFVASFMTRPFESDVGASGHLNHSLWTPDGKTQMTADASRPYGLSEIGEYWVAGLLEHACALSFLQAPTVNCRDRISPNNMAPCNATWGVDNRSCAIRLKKQGKHGLYLENRIGSSAGNPYISLAATIAAGIDGIERKLSLPAPIPLDKLCTDEGHLPPDTALLPTDVESAIQCLRKDDVMMNAFGEDFVNNLESIRRFESEKITEEDKYASSRMLYFDYI